MQSVRLTTLTMIRTVGRVDKAGVGEIMNVIAGFRYSTSATQIPIALTLCKVVIKRDGVFLPERRGKFTFAFHLQAFKCASP